MRKNSVSVSVVSFFDSVLIGERSTSNSGLHNLGYKVAPKRKRLPNLVSFGGVFVQVTLVGLDYDEFFEQRQSY